MRTYDPADYIRYVRTDDTYAYVTLPPASASVEIPLPRGYANQPGPARALLRSARPPGACSAGVR